VFDNIIGQDQVIGLLKTDLVQKNLPPALLFTGSEFTGKLTTALELARVLTCHSQAEWNCTCQSCKRQRILLHPATVMTGGRYFREEIAACADALIRTRKTPAQFLFVRSVRKLLRRLDGILWEGEEIKTVKASPFVQEIEESLIPLQPGNNLTDYESISELCYAVIAGCEKILSMVSFDPITVNQIRRLTAWANLSSQFGKKIIIIERAETLQESGRNALLKTLEEPPPDTWFILITSSRSAMIQTILSRVRVYEFLPRTEASSREVMEKIFRETEISGTSIQDYFYDSAGEVQAETSRLQKRAEVFLSSGLQNKHEYVFGELPGLLKDLAASDTLQVFLEDISGAVLKGMKAGTIPLLLTEKILAELRSTRARALSLNLTTSMVLQNLFLSLGMFASDKSLRRLQQEPVS
jgi:DNA polymerase III delta prime subunit